MLKFLICVAMCGVAGMFGQNTGTVSGAVRTERSQFPITASITVISSSGGGVRLVSIPSDERGEFSVEVPAGRVLLVARADGYAPEQQEVFVRPGRANPTLNFSLTPAGSVSGRVVNAAGGGIPGARVWLQYRGEAAAWRLADEAGGLPTDATGAFTIPVVAQGRPFVLHVESDDWLLSSSPTMSVGSPQLEGVLLVLSRRGARVTGHVRDSVGRPVSGVQVQLRATPAEKEFSAEQRQSMAFSRSMIRSAVTGTDGSYWFGGVPAGHIVLTAHAQNQRASAETDTGPDRLVTLELSLQ